MSDRPVHIGCSGWNYADWRGAVYPDGCPPRNRDPRADEVAHHLPWLQAQLEVIRPRLIVPVGRHALKRFAPRAAIGEVHGRVLQADGRTLFPMYHPAAAMHNQRLLPTLIADARALREVLAS